QTRCRSGMGRPLRCLREQPGGTDQPRSEPRGQAMSQMTRKCVRVVVGTFVFSLPLMAFPVLGASAASSGFVIGVLSPPPAGSTTQFNEASEPAIRSDPSGTFYISSENSIGTGTDAWRSTNGGTRYVSIPQP